uniref:Uncharacterized protein n=1 Tax=Coccidioides posadasii RMSCC 3488 TaxID=454284 RepID=A0A0J6EY92_COCPO|nr:hypothetical protein CPAG_01895 [Coccidioides posadasii RMSCC 3488]
MDWAVSDAAGSGPREGGQVTVRGGVLLDVVTEYGIWSLGQSTNAARRQPITTPTTASQTCGFWGTGKMGEKLGDAGECSDVSPTWELRQAVRRSTDRHTPPPELDSQFPGLVYDSGTNDHHSDALRDDD